MTAPIACEDWPAILDGCAKSCAHFRRVTVLRETDSTQDAAQRLRAVPGDVVTTFRQTAGRGRLGRRWIDTGEHGLAVTCVVSASVPERLAMLCAVAAARTAAHVLQPVGRAADVGIRWPNDIVVAGRKLAGILVEQDRHTARIGIGMNVTQQRFPAEVADRACSLAQLGATVDRVHAIAQLIRRLDEALSESDEQLSHAFRERDVLLGQDATFEIGRRRVSGRVVEVDPLHGLRVATAEGETFLPAGSTSLAAFASAPGMPPA